MRRLFLLIGVVIVICFGITGVYAMASNDNLIFYQVRNGQKTLYFTDDNGSNLKPLATGKDIAVFSINRRLIFFNERQLFEYKADFEEPVVIHKFNKDEDRFYAFSMAPAGPDQALVVAGNAYSSFPQWYILDFSDNSLRKIDAPFTTLPEGKPEFYSPDENAEATIKKVTFNYRFEIIIREKTAGKLKTVWTLPKNMTVLPARPVWAPNSRMVAFYGAEFLKKDNLRGPYSLYIFNLDTKSLILVRERVFSIANYSSNIEMGEFKPDWSGDSSKLIVQYQPFGLPMESSILRYDVESARSTYLGNSKGDKQYPKWSPSNRKILFFSSRDGDGIQLFVMNADGTGLKRLSPDGGVTEWAEWINLK